MKKNHIRSSGSLFLMEMLLVLLFLALASAACVRISGVSWQYKTRAEESRSMLRLLSFMGESLEAWDGIPEHLLLPDSAVSAEDASLLLSYDKAWNSCSEETSFYTLQITPEITGEFKQLNLTFRRKEQILRETTLKFPLLSQEEVTP